MAYFDLEENISSKTFDILEPNYSEHYKIIYIIKHKNFGILNKISAHIPKDSEYLYRVYSEEEMKKFDLDSEYLTYSKNKNPIHYTYKEVMKNCYSPVYVSPTTTFTNRYYYKVFCNNKLSDLVIKKNKNINIWSVCSEGKNYLDIIFNNGLNIRYERPDDVHLLKPKIIKGINSIPYHSKSLYDLYYIRSSPIIEAYTSRNPRWCPKNERYTLKFLVHPGISSIKNTNFIKEGSSQKSQSHMELLRLSSKVVSVIYKEPFTFLHAFFYGVARAHSTKSINLI